MERAPRCLPIAALYTRPSAHGQAGGPLAGVLGGGLWAWGGVFMSGPSRAGPGQCGFDGGRMHHRPNRPNHRQTAIGGAWTKPARSAARCRGIRHMRASYTQGGPEDANLCRCKGAKCISSRSRRQDRPRPSCRSTLIMISMMRTSISSAEFEDDWQYQ